MSEAKLIARLRIEWPAWMKACCSQVRLGLGNSKQALTICAGTFPEQGFFCALFHPAAATRL
jgi:hypothetical protein